DRPGGGRCYVECISGNARPIRAGDRRPESDLRRSLPRVQHGRGITRKAIAERPRGPGRTVMDHHLGGRLSQYRCDLVLRLQKSEHALFDDDNALGAFGAAHLPIGRLRSPVPRRDQCWARTIRNYVFETHGSWEMIAATISL